MNQNIPVWELRSHMPQAKKNVLRRDFPGGPVVKNMPCNAGDMGSTPGLQTKIPQATGQQTGCPLQLRPNTAK